MATNRFSPNLRPLKEEVDLELLLKQKKEKEKKKHKDKLIAERPNRTSRYQSAKELVELGMHLEARANGEYMGKGKVIKTVTELSKFEKSVEPASEVWYTLSLKPNETYPNGLVAIDVDEPKVWGKLTLSIKEGTINFKNPIINTTFRGGHIIYEADKLESTKVNVPLKAGFHADYLTSRVSILGPGKYISSIPENRSVMPVIVNFLKKNSGLKTPPIINGLQIIEGFRNDTIFKWVNGKLDCDVETRKAISRLLGRYFCIPPLDIRECMSLVKENIENNLAEEEEIYINAKVITNVSMDINLMQGQLKNKYSFDETVGQFYKFTGSYWHSISEDHMVNVIESILLDPSNRFKCRMTQHTTRNIAKTHANRSKHYLSVPDVWRDYPQGINWQNGYLDVESGELLDHRYDRWVTDIRDTNYDKNETLSYENQKLIVQSCGGNVHTINALLSCGNRVLSPKPWLGTSYYFSGPAGSGKSLFTNCFVNLAGNKAIACEVTDMGKSFTRASLVGKDLLVFNEFIKLSSQSKKHLKSLIGRDTQVYEIKYVQGQRYKVFEGIIIIVSNLGPQLTYGMSPVMIDRFIPVGFSPRLGEANPNLAKQLNDNQSGLVNLLMGMDPSIFENLTRAGLINKEVTYESNVLIPFILSKLFFEVGSAVSVMALNEGYRQWVLMQNEKKAHSIIDLFNDLASVSLSMFNRRLIKNRRFHFGKKTTVIVGIRWREKTDPNQDVEHNSFQITNDFWFALRGKTNEPLYEIADYYSDLEKSNKQVNSDGNIINIPKPLETTELVQKQYLDKKDGKISKKKKRKIST